VIPYEPSSGSATGLGSRRRGPDARVRGRRRRALAPV